MKTLRTLLCALAVVAATMTAAHAALPTNPTSSLMTNGDVRAMALVGGHLFVGGNFSRVETRSGATVANVQNLAVFNSTGDTYLGTVGLPSTADKVVWDIEAYGDDVIVGGRFSGPGSSRNLVRIDAGSLSVERWYSSPTAKAVLGLDGRVYAGSSSLSAWTDSGTKVFSAKTPLTTDDDLRTHNTPASYRDLDRFGSGLVAACQCDTAGGDPSKALIRLDADGNRTGFNPAGVGTDAFGIATEVDGDDLYLAAGGSDFAASFTSSGAQRWKRDTSGSAQQVTQMDGLIIFGGHFVEVADQPGDGCGFRFGPGDPNLDPNDECETRRGLAAYTPSGDLTGWNPSLTGRYTLAWALVPDGGALHVGGEFTKVNDIKALSYARLD